MQVRPGSRAACFRDAILDRREPRTKGHRTLIVLFFFGLKLICRRSVLIDEVCLQLEQSARAVKIENVAFSQLRGGQFQGAQSGLPWCLCESSPLKENVCFILPL